MKRKLAFIAGAAVIAAGSAIAAERVNESAYSKLAAMERTGESTTCISVRNLGPIVAVTENQLLVRTGASTYYLNETNGKCRGATRHDTHFVYTTTITQLCQGDLIRVMYSDPIGNLAGTCTLGSFEKLQAGAAATN
jgi:hypothetical protein